jgi:cold shock CspA family protein
VEIRGRVESFDERRGDGRLVSEKGERLYFHCVDIADGSRTIEVGQPVTAERSVGHLGHDEAVKVTKRSGN